jgi:hypothetical protein
MLQIRVSNKQMVSWQSCCWSNSFLHCTYFFVCVVAKWLIIGFAIARVDQVCRLKICWIRVCCVSCISAKTANSCCTHVKVTWLFLFRPFDLNVGQMQICGMQCDTTKPLKGPFVLLESVDHSLAPLSWEESFVKAWLSWEYFNHLWKKLPLISSAVRWCFMILSHLGDKEKLLI